LAQGATKRFGNIVEFNFSHPLPPQNENLKIGLGTQEEEGSKKGESVLENSARS
jgi:hypothetical protein